MWSGNKAEVKPGFAGHDQAPPLDNMVKLWLPLWGMVCKTYIPKCKVLATIIYGLVHREAWESAWTFVPLVQSKYFYVPLSGCVGGSIGCAV